MGARRKATFYVDSQVHKALRLKAAEADVSPSDLLNELLSEDLKNYLEDMEDIQVATVRSKNKKDFIPFDKLKKKLKANE